MARTATDDDRHLQCPAGKHRKRHDQHPQTKENTDYPNEAAQKQRGRQKHPLQLIPK